MFFWKRMGLDISLYLLTSVYSAKKLFSLKDTHLEFLLGVKHKKTGVPKTWHPA